MTVAVSAKSPYCSLDDLRAATEPILIATSGQDSANYHQSHLLAEALGVPVIAEPVRAYMWHTLAKKNGSPVAADYRNDLFTTMTPDQIAEGERLAAEWTPESPCP